MNDDQITQLLTESAPKPRPEFTDSLDLRVANGFRTPPISEAAAPMSRLARATHRIRRAVEHRRLSLGTSLVAGTCALLLVAVVAVPLAMNGDEDTSYSTQEDSGSTVSGAGAQATSTGSDVTVSADPPAAVDPAAPTEESTTSARSTVIPKSSASKVTEPERQHILGVGMFLEVEPKQVPDVVAKSTKVAESLGGYVADSSYNVTESGATGMAELWVPTKQNAVAMARLARLGTVVRTTQGSDDVTDARADDVRALQDTKDQLRALDPTAPKAQRDALQARIDAQQQRLDNLDARISMSRITLNVTGVEAETKVEKPAEPWTIAWAWEQTTDIFSHMAAGAIVFGAVLLVPVLLIAALWLALATRRRRLRERTLDDE